ncbi:hypothetical protein XENOCAPTIV_009393 [Xenoophorus captivus]|uniref:Translation elongation factor EF1B beta/delta subunit guanine nucleotide exchange domain-containing protein n=1 Tax=Xenoophorus captivus TaxID=1517983 RepID=A0ABV0QV80_9TELE
MSKKISQCSVKDQSEHEQPPSHSQLDQNTKAVLGCRKTSEPSQRNGETTSSSPESGSLNGNGKRSGKSRRRRKRSSNPGSHHEGKADEVKDKEKPDEHTSQSHDHQAVLMGLQSECGSVWFERNIYEQAESLYQCWLVSSSNRTSKPNRSHQPSGKHSTPLSAVTPSTSGPTCHHGDQMACHHVVEEVWVNKMTFDQAERRFAEESAPPSVPNSLDLPAPTNCCSASRTPDEGYQSQAPTPATPVVQQAAGSPTARQSINGLPRLPVELLREVWLDKPLYDRAEAAFYQNLYANNSSKRQICTSTSRGSDHPQSLMEEEEEEDEDDAAEEEKRLVLQCKAEVFHALHPIQEEEEPAELHEMEETSGVCFFFHSDSEPVWLDKWRYDAAESRFHSSGSDKVCAVKKNRRPEAETSSAASKTPKRDKYDQTGGMEPHQMFQAPAAATVQLIKENSFLASKASSWRTRVYTKWDDETDMAKLEECVRSVQADGLLWGTSKLVPVGYGIKKLQIACVVEDDKVGTDLLEEEITKFEDYVSTWIYCFGVSVV